MCVNMGKLDLKIWKREIKLLKPSRITRKLKIGGGFEAKLRQIVRRSWMGGTLCTVVAKGAPVRTNWRRRNRSQNMRKCRAWTWGKDSEESQDGQLCSIGIVEGNNSTTGREDW